VCLVNQQNGMTDSEIRNNKFLFSTEKQVSFKNKSKNDFNFLGFLFSETVR